MKVSVICRNRIKQHNTCTNHWGHYVVNQLQGADALLEELKSSLGIMSLNTCLQEGTIYK